MTTGQPEIPTSLELEREEHKRWVPLKSGSYHRRFAGLLENEFRPPEFHRKIQLRRLLRIAEFAEKQVPFYRERFSNSKIHPKDLAQMDNLPCLPVLNKNDLLDHFASMQAVELPAGEREGRSSVSSGTTGRPVIVSQTKSSLRSFSIFWCRQARWFRLNPQGIFARIRFAENLKARADGTAVTEGNTLVTSGWTFAKKYFQTGPEISCTIGNSREWQVQWLEEHRPNYLLSFPGVLEELALANECRSPCDSLQGLLPVSSLLTPSMSDLIQRTFKAPVHQNYGLNEVGIVAARCAAGRYHVHSETNMVEIVDNQGSPVSPGEIGRLLVTNFRNYRMPLIRYDTGDVAIAAEGPCPCGRTLPSIADIVGRYRRFAFLPEGSRERYHSISDTIEGMPAELLLKLRQFQVHQFSDNRFEVRLRVIGKLPEEFYNRVRAAWQAVVTEKEFDGLLFKHVEEIGDAPGGKLLEFTSDFYPEIDNNETIAGRNPG